MNKLFLLAFFFFVSCMPKVEKDKVYQLIREKFPQDDAIDKSFERIERERQDLIYEKEFYFPYDDYIPSTLKEIYESPFLELHHIYEIQTADKLIHKYLKNRKFYEKNYTK